MADKKKKKNVKEKIKEGVREIKKKVAELEQLEDTLEEIEGGIFDEDLDHVEEVGVSDFDIGDVMLTAAPAVESWAGKNLEEEVGREHPEWNWKAEDEAVTGEVYNSDSSGDVYGTASSSDAYSSGGGRDDVYSSSGDGAYNEGKSGEGSYGAQGGNKELKTHDQVKDERRGERSMLEIGGFEDLKKKDHDKFTREFSAYEAGKAA